MKYLINTSILETDDNNNNDECDQTSLKQVNVNNNLDNTTATIGDNIKESEQHVEKIAHKQNWHEISLNGETKEETTIKVNETIKNQTENVKCEVKEDKSQSYEKMEQNFTQATNKIQKQITDMITQKFSELDIYHRVIFGLFLFWTFI